MGVNSGAQAALATMLIVIFGGAVVTALATPLLPGHHRVAVALFAALPIAAVRCAIQVLENDDG